VSGAVDKAKDTLGVTEPSKVDEAIDTAAEATQQVLPDSASSTIQNVADKAKDAL
jgi:hypothetical protein